MIALVNQALTRRSPLERAADRVARMFVPCVILMSRFPFGFGYFARRTGLAVAFKTITFFGWSGRLQGLLAFGDKLRADATGVVDELRGRGCKVHLVCGDSFATTRWIASCFGGWELLAH